MNYIELLFIIIAAWRVSYLFVFDAGPYDMFIKLREWGTGKGWFPFDCISCTSIWIGAVAALFVDLPYVVGLLVISAAILFTNAIYERLI